MDFLICARMGSTRLPGKALIPLLEKKHSLDILLEKFKIISPYSRVILATTTLSKDDLLEEWAIKNQVKIFRGSEKDVLGRLNNAVNYFNCENIIEILGDNPLVPIELIKKCISIYKKQNDDLKYLASSTSEYKFSNPKKNYPIGIRVQIFNKNFINCIEKIALGESYREHSTSFIYDKPDLCDLKLVETEEQYAEKIGKFNFAINTIDQLNNAKDVLKKYGINCKVGELVDWVNRNV